MILELVVKFISDLAIFVWVCLGMEKLTPVDAEEHQTEV
jgi:hypothetical protein